MDGGQHPVISSDDRTRSWLILAVGAVVTTALVLGVIRLWPDDDGATATTTDQTSTSVRPAGEVTATTRAGTGEPSQQTTTTAEASQAGPGALFEGDLPAAYAALLAAAGQPAQVIELAVYDTYAFLAYRDPANPGNIDRRIWRDGEVGAAEANPIDDRVDADTEPKLFGPAELDPMILARLVDDAPGHYELPTAVTHVLIDRFLPFDQRVLIRVYASPTDGRSGGGYVSYDLAGAFVDVCC